ncbi:MAG: RNase H-like domain-containing protein, partial [Candidatus Thiodiazotropha sp.]
HELRSFLGTASYYRKFCKSFCDIARPLHKLTEKQNGFVWTAECDQAFNQLKRVLTSAPVLAYPQSHAEYILDCDCSGYGLGSVLSQKQDGVERVISYFSKSLTKAERNYCVTRRELLAVVSAVKHYHHYLFGAKFTIRTDHSALRWLLKTFKNPEGQISRWIEVLSAYNFDIQHRSGKLHGNCDGLSRIPCNHCPCCRRLEEKEKQITVDISNCSCAHPQTNDPPITQGTSPGPEPDSGHSLSPCKEVLKNEVSSKPYRRVTTRSQTQSCIVMKQWLDAKSHEDIKNEQSKDGKIATVLKWKEESGERPNWDQVSHLDADHKTFWSQWDRLIVKEGILYRRWVNEATGKDQFELVIPEIWRDDIIRMFHATPGAGHFGIKRTVERLRSRAYWPRITDSVKRHCQRCEQCQKKKNPAKTPKAPMKKFVSGVPNERVQIDIVGPLIESQKSNKYLIVLTDCFTKWASAHAVPRATANAVADAVLDWVSRFGVMQVLHSDQGKQFEATVIADLCQKLGILKTRATSYYAPSDGQVERLNRTLIEMLSKYVEQNHRTWDDHLPLVLLAYNSSVHESTSLSPAMMTYGRELDLPADLIFGSPERTSGQDREPSKYVQDLAESMEKVHELARKKLSKSNDIQKRRYDLKQYKHNYRVGDRVLLFTPAVKQGNCRKLDSHWTGPYIITEVLSDVVFRIKLNNLSRDKIVHHNRLKPYRE